MATVQPHSLALAPGMHLPLDVVTETIAVLGIRGSGKTNTCVVLTEELLEAGQQVVVIDPTDAWWGIRSSKDGARDGYPVVVFGGRHGDVPLSAADGAVVADAIVDNRIPAILSLRHFESQADQRRLVTDFARRVYHRKGEEGRDTPMLLVIDEAHLFCPQRVGAAEAQMVGAIQKIVRQGRSSGLGVCLIDQRAASVNKDLLTQLELLVAHRTSSPQDRKALEAWIEQHDTDDRKGAFLSRLPALERGTAWFWSPGWLDIFKEVHVRARRTFDSSATPKPGERAIAPTKLAAVDLDALRAKLATTIEQAKADDPKVLRAEIADLKRQLVARPLTEPKVVERVVDRVVRDEALVSKLRELEAVVKDLEIRLETAMATAHGVVVDLYRARECAESPPAGVEKTSEVTARTPMVGVRPDGDQLASRRAEPPKSAAPSRGSTSLGAGEHAVLVAIAQHRGGVTREQITILTGYKRSTRDAYVQRLAQKGYIKVAELITATVAALDELGPSFEPLPTGRKLRDHWLARLPEGEAKVLEVLVDAYPRAVDREVIGKITDYKRSTRDAYIQRLGVRKLAVVGRDGVSAAAELFA